MLSCPECLLDNHPDPEHNQKSELGSVWEGQKGRVDLALEMMVNHQEDSVVAAAGMVVCLSVWAFVFTFYCCGTEVDPRTFYIVGKHTWKNF